MPDEVALSPKVDELVFDGRLTGSLDIIKSKLSQIPFYYLKQAGNELSIVKVESRNISKKPYLFYIIKLRKDGISLIYSIPQDTSDRMRRATVIKDVLSVLSIISDQYTLDAGKFYQYVDSVIENLLSGMTETYSSLFNKYDSLLNEYREVKKLDLEYATANRNLTIQTAQLNEENKSLKADLAALQKFTDESLMSMVGDWIQVHNSTIDIDDFAKTYNVSQPRVEQILNKMVAQGYLELKE